MNRKMECIHRFTLTYPDEKHEDIENTPFIPSLDWPLLLRRTWGEVEIKLTS